MGVNLFVTGGGPFVSPLLVGVSKADLVAGEGAPKFPGSQTLAGWPAEPLAFSLMPARTQARPHALWISVKLFLVVLLLCLHMQAIDCMRLTCRRRWV